MCLFSFSPCVLPPVVCVQVFVVIVVCFLEVEEMHVIIAVFYVGRLTCICYELWDNMKQITSVSV